MDAKNDEAIFIGYALNSKTYRVFNKTSLIVEESFHVIFYETNVALRKGVIVDDEANIEIKILKNQRRRSKKIARKIHPWEIYKERKINKMISQRLGST